MSWRWPVELRQELADGRRLTLRRLVRADRAEWEALRRRNVSWLRPWESTEPGAREATLPFHQMRRMLDRGARDGLVLPFVIEVDGRLVGQMQLFDVLWGARRSGVVVTRVLREVGNGRRERWSGRVTGSSTAGERTANSR